MKAKIEWNGRWYDCDLSKGVDLSIAFQEAFNQVNCFYAPFFSSQPVRMDGFVGSVKEGGPVNFYNAFINVHGSGTHTECVGHISPDRESVNRVLKNYFGVAQLMTVYPTKMENGDRAITSQSLRALMEDETCAEFVVLRTLPNPESKRNLHYSGTNPPYMEADAVDYLIQLGMKHILLDLPSVDREQDGGALAGHRRFWKGERAEDCTITELIYVPDHLKDGYYFINLQLASMEQDAAPSRPVLFALNETGTAA